MVYRMLSRSKNHTLILAAARKLLHNPSPTPIESQSIRCLHSLVRSQPSDHPVSSSTLFSTPSVSSNLSTPKDINGEVIVEPKTNLTKKEVLCFSPLETISNKARNGGLGKESLKIKRMELSQKITFALIPALILISKSSVATSLLIFSVYWQVYGFFKEIFLDYVHHEVTRAWVLIYFKILLIILAKETIINFGLV